MDSTACSAAFFRAAETLMDKHIRIITDEYAHDLLPYAILGISGEIC